MERSHPPMVVNVLAGVWLALAPFVLGYSWIDSARWNDVLVGVAVAALAVGRLRGLGAGACWAMAVLGFWQLLAPAMFGYRGFATANMNDVVMGGIIAAMAIWSAYALPYHGRPYGPEFTSAEPSDDDLPPGDRRGDGL